jgi:hypothetical protein
MRGWIGPFREGWVVPLMLTGYLHPGYAQSLAEFGKPRLLPRSGAWVLERTIPGSSERDAMGCYPLFCCPNWDGLREDLQEMGDLVSLVIVADPFTPCSREELAGMFDVVVNFKEHFVADLDRPMEQIVSSSHRRTTRRAQRKMETVETCDRPLDHLDEWMAIYDCLIERHKITGIRAFSRPSFAAQLALPGMVMVRGTVEGQAASMELWCHQGEVAYSHLTACTPRGYETRAAYATKWHTLDYFRGKVRWLGMGGGAGGGGGMNDGLTDFKRGWATGTMPAHLCGKIFDRAKYDHLSATRGAGATPYFPAYRHGEFS